MWESHSPPPSLPILSSARENPIVQFKNVHLLANSCLLKERCGIKSFSSSPDLLNYSLGFDHISLEDNQCFTINYIIASQCNASLYFFFNPCILMQIFANSGPQYLQGEVWLFNALGNVIYISVEKSRAQRSVWI